MFSLTNCYTVSIFVYKTILKLTGNIIFEQVIKLKIFHNLLQQFSGKLREPVTLSQYNCFGMVYSVTCCRYFYLVHPLSNTPSRQSKAGFNSGNLEPSAEDYVKFFPKWSEGRVVVLSETLSCGQEADTRSSDTGVELLSLMVSPPLHILGSDKQTTKRISHPFQQCS